MTMRMDKERYRRAVSGIRWTEKQRAAMRKKLKEPAKKAADDFFDDFDEKPLTKEEQRRMEEEMAKQEKRIRRLSKSGRAVAAALLILVGGGVTAGIIHAKKLKKQEANAAMGVFGLHLTDQKDSPSRLSFSQSEQGYYIGYNNYEYSMSDFSVQTDMGEEIQFEALCQNQQRALPTFYDPETGESAVLCARPNCTHDGSTYCTATTRVYGAAAGGDIYFTYADGYLYRVTGKHNLKTMDDGSVTYDDTETHAVLLRYEPDGSGITELYDFGTGGGGSMPVVHRCYLWFSVQLKTYGDIIKNKITGSESRFCTGGYEIWGYELKTGKLTKVYTAMEAPTANLVATAPEYLNGIGDYLYFDTADGDMITPTGTNRINLLTGELSKAPDISLEYGFNEHYGLHYNRVLQGGDNVGCWQLVNLDTGETKDIPNSELSTGYIGTPFLSGDYIYWFQHGENSEDNIIRMYDLNLNKLLGVNVSESGLPTIRLKDAKIIPDIGICKVQDGKLFVSYDLTATKPEYGMWWTVENSVYSCNVSDLLDGKLEWTKVFESMDSGEAQKQFEKAYEIAEKALKDKR